MIAVARACPESTELCHDTEMGTYKASAANLLDTYQTNMMEITWQIYWLYFSLAMSKNVNFYSHSIRALLYTLCSLLKLNFKQLLLHCILGPLIETSQWSIFHVHESSLFSFLTLNVITILLIARKSWAWVTSQSKQLSEGISLETVTDCVHNRIITPSAKLENT